MKSLTTQGVHLNPEDQLQLRKRQQKQVEVLYLFSEEEISIKDQWTEIQMISPLIYLINVSLLTANGVHVSRSVSASLHQLGQLSHIVVRLVVVVLEHAVILYFLRGFAYLL